MTHQGFLLVYHGCDATVGEQILQGKDHVRPSSNKHDWLGYLDCAVIEFLHVLEAKKERPPFDSVRGAFFEGGNLYPGARIFAKTHIQWCVRDPLKNIVGYFRVPPSTRD